jgi:hypothetical protein
VPGNPHNPYYVRQFALYTLRLFRWLLRFVGDHPNCNFISGKKLSKPPLRHFKVMGARWIEGFEEGFARVLRPLMAHNLSLGTPSRKSFN